MFIEEENKTMHDDRIKYIELEKVLQAAYDQAAVGKGKERHANDLSFEDQPMQTISKLLDDDTGMAFQAIKKLREGMAFEDFARFERELLGAIVYIAGMIIYRKNKDEGDHEKDR